MTRVGIDLAMRGTHTAVLARGREVLGKPFRVATTTADMEDLLKRANGAVQVGAAQAVEFVLEPTGNIWRVVGSWLLAHGARVRVVKPQKSSDLRKFLRRHTKSDAVDAAALAQLPEVDPRGAPEMQAVSPTVLTLQRLVKQRLHFVQQATKCKLRVEAAVELVNPHLLDELGPDKFSATARVLLRNLLNPLDVVPQGRPTWEEELRQASRGTISAARLDRLWEAYVKVVDYYEPVVKRGLLPFDGQALQDEVRRELAVLEFVEEQIGQLDEAIADAYQQIDPHQVLRQLPGLGPLLAATVEAFSRPLNRFRNAGAFAAFCGVVPRRSQTGRTDRLGLPMTKAGQRVLKRALRLAADVARQHDPELAHIYESRRARGWHHERILGLLAHKLARRAWAVLRRREEAVRTGKEIVPYELRTAAGRVVDRKTGRALAQSCRDRYRRRSESKRTADGPVQARRRTDAGPPSNDDATRRRDEQQHEAVGGPLRSTTQVSRQHRRSSSGPPPWGPCPNGHSNCTASCCWPRFAAWHARLLQAVENGGENLRSTRADEVPKGP